MTLTETSDQSFDSLELVAPLRRALKERGFEKPTPIQAAAIPEILDGRDLIGLAQTGTGKTAAFVLPLLQNLYDDASEESARLGRAQTYALILAPTRELAVQIHEDVERFGKPLKLTSAVILGGVSRGPQEKRLAHGVDVVVGTPGRILDLIGTRHLDLRACTDFVLDEADQMLDLGFIKDVRAIAAKMPKDRQTLMFSATWPESVAGLARELLTDPAQVEAGVREQKPTPERIAQEIRFVGGAVSRPDALREVFVDEGVARAIVFTRTKRGANKVAEMLVKAGVAAEPIHGNKSQNARQRALESFKTGGIRALVATDIAARGIDVPHVSHVLNYDMPDTAEAYVHRIGRTARAGREGLAISLCGPEEMGELRAIERLIGFSIPVAGDAPRPSREEERAAAAERPAKKAGRGGGGARRGPQGGGKKAGAEAQKGPKPDRRRPRGGGEGSRKTAGKAAGGRRGRAGAAA